MPCAPARWMLVSWLPAAGTQALETNKLAVNCCLPACWLPVDWQTVSLFASVLATICCKAAALSARHLAFS